MTYSEYLKEKFINLYLKNEKEKFFEIIKSWQNTSQEILQLQNKQNVSDRIMNLREKLNKNSNLTNQILKY